MRSQSNRMMGWLVAGTLLTQGPSAGQDPPGTAASKLAELEHYVDVAYAGNWPLYIGSIASAVTMAIVVKALVPSSRYNEALAAIRRATRDVSKATKVQEENNLRIKELQERVSRVAKALGELAALVRRLEAQGFHGKTMDDLVRWRRSEGGRTFLKTDDGKGWAKEYREAFGRFRKSEDVERARALYNEVIEHTNRVTGDRMAILGTETPTESIDFKRGWNGGNDIYRNYNIYEATWRLFGG